MKRFIWFLLFFVLSVIPSFAESADSVQVSKDYQAACIYRQIIDEMMYHMDDREKAEAEEIICGALENLDCYEAIIVTRNEMETNYNRNYVQ